MQMQPDTSRWPHRVTQDVRRRLMVSTALRATASGLAVGAIAAVFSRVIGWSAASSGFVTLAVTLSATAVWFLRRLSRWTLAAAADAIEAHSNCRNVVVTAVELTRYPERAQRWVRERIFADAGHLLDQIDPRTVVPLRRSAVLSAVALTATLAILLGIDRSARELLRTAPERAARDAGTTLSGEVTATLSPPAYTRQPVRRLSDPERINAVEGTRLRMEIRDVDSSASVRFGSEPLRTTTASGVAAAEMALTRSGYLAIAVKDRVRLIPVTVTPDRPPAIRVERPGRDLLLADAASAVGVEAAVTDDFAIADLRLRYTTVSGSGEQFAFRQGEVPVSVTASNRAAWRGRGTIGLPGMQLQPGDSLVYSFVARDERPGGTGTSVSETFFIEIAGPGQVALEATGMPPDQDRYALSQQMIVVKIERLREREQRLTQDALEKEGADIAAEQRAVKANFIFLMGGQVEDEDVEAEQSPEIQEGRLENTARREISRSVDHMTRTEQALTTTDTGSALRQARLAVEALQRAFGRNRYILRSLATRDRIDPSRRLTGKLDGARTSERTQARTEDSSSQKIRDLFNATVAVGDDLSAGRGVEPKLSVLSERALAIDPADATWQRIAKRFETARDRTTRAAALEDLREAGRLIAIEAQRVALAGEPVPGAGSILRGAWADELPRGGRSKQ